MKFEEIMEIIDAYKDYEDVYAILKACNIDLAYDDDLAGNKDCRIFSCKEGNCVFIKEQLDPMIERFLLLHEIAHYLMHYGVSTYFTPTGRLEREANLFACLWLIKNDIEDSLYYDQYLIGCGVPITAAVDFQEALYQYRQTKRYGNVWLRMEC